MTKLTSKMVWMSAELRAAIEDHMILNGQKFSPLVCALIREYLESEAQRNDQD